MVHFFVHVCRFISLDYSMERILERYERKIYAPTGSESQVSLALNREILSNICIANWSLESSKLMSTIEVLQRNLRYKY
ncbi:hypothetical protein Goarm_018271, partial [Gossypium armourianum]|nr:hypothetical protein [Gossypium armourianum]